MNQDTAEVAPARVGRYFSRVVVERYPDELAIPATGPVLADLDSIARTPLTPAQRSAARGLVQAEIDTYGSYRIRKHTVLLTAVRQDEWQATPRQCAPHIPRAMRWPHSSAPTGRRASP